MRTTDVPTDKVPMLRVPILRVLSEIDNPPWASNFKECPALAGANVHSTYQAPTESNPCIAEEDTVGRLEPEVTRTGLPGSSTGLEIISSGRIKV